MISRQRKMLVLAVLLLGVAAFRAVKYLQMWHQLVAPLSATLPADIHLLPGFKVDLLHVAAANEGSWISMTIDPQGRFIVSAERQNCLLRLTVADGKLKKIETICQGMGSAMGLLYAKDSLFVDGQGPQGWGVYRLRDNGSVFDKPKMLCPLHFTESSHGAHAILLTPDDKLHVVCGDHTQLPTDISPDSPFQNYAEDQLLPEDADTAGWDLSVRVPNGFILRMNLDGKNREVFAGGARNNYTVALNRDGELFGFDNDHNNDYGLPWYRPIRINHWISGGDFGFRRGTGKFPEYYEDNLPPTLNAGLGAPSGVKFAPANCHFPPPYREAAFMEDWLYGRLFAVHFFPRGATYDATIETVLHGTPLNMSALEFGRDGALYFITGGNGTSSGLYRLTYTGARVPEVPMSVRELAAEKEGGAARALRHELESFQGRRDPRAVGFLWPFLNSNDRWIRYAARTALEFQPVDLWEDRALSETNAYGGLTALLGLARVGGQQTQRGLLKALEKFAFPSLTEEQKLLKLRVMELSFIRQGHPTADEAASVIAELDPLYPSSSENINRELCQLLLYLDAPGAIPKTLALIHTAAFAENQIYYVMRLRNISQGWTMAERKDYLGWFAQDHSHLRHRPEFVEYFKALGQDYADGAGFGVFLDNFRKESIATLSDSERRELTEYGADQKPAVPLSPPRGKFVKAWRMADLLPDISNLKKGRHLARGKNLFVQAQCIVCHHFCGEGGSFGPDLTSVGSRLAPRDILESILDPSAVIVDQYRDTLLTLKNGDVVSGRVIDEDDNELLVLTEPVNLTRVSVRKADIVARRISKISPMPEGLANSMTEDEIWDLVAFLKAGPRGAATPPK